MELKDVLTRLVEQLVVANPESLAQIEPSTVLCVAGAARNASRASIRPFTYGGAPPKTKSNGHEKPTITICGTRILYEICLRPRFFLTTTPRERVEIVAHELWHIDARCDGTLDESRRHASSPGPMTIIDEIVERWHEVAGEVPAALRHDGDVSVPAWLVRPPSRIAEDDPLRRVYTDRDLYVATCTIRNA